MSDSSLYPQDLAHDLLFINLLFVNFLIHICRLNECIVIHQVIPIVNAVLIFYLIVMSNPNNNTVYGEDGILT